MRKRLFTAALAAALVAGTGALTACSGGGSDSKTLTYWASNQGTSLQNDKDVLAPELKKFQQQSGIKVNVQVIGWNDLLNRIMSATTSGQGPDVVNIGNTWSASLQATGAFTEFNADNFTKIGGKSRFLATSLSSTGAKGKTPTSVPLYGLAYGLYYNKKQFAAAGITQPPATWEELVADAKKLTNPAQQHYGMTLAGASYTENAHFAFMFGKQQGTSFFKGDKADFATPQGTKAVAQYLDLLSTQKVATPASAEHATTSDAIPDFASGKAAMMMGQNNTTNGILAQGMKAEDIGVAPIPFPASLPAGGEKINSHVAGINIAAFKGKNEDGAMKFIKFMTSADEQKILNKKFSALPVTTDAASDPAFTGTPADGVSNKVFLDVLAHTSAPMPMITNESGFETTIGNAMKDLIAQAATGKQVSDADITAALTSAQQKMASGGN